MQSRSGGPAREPAASEFERSRVHFGRSPVTSIAISTTIADGGEYAAAVTAAGGVPRLLTFDADTVDEQLAGVAGVLLSGGGDVEPSRYGRTGRLAAEIDPVRDAFEIAVLAERANAV